MCIHHEQSNVNTHSDTHTYTYACSRRYTHKKRTHAHARTHAWTHAWTHVRTRKHERAQTHAHTHTHKHTNHLLPQPRTQTYAQTHTHTHTSVGLVSIILCTYISDVVLQPPLCSPWLPEWSVFSVIYKSYETFKLQKNAVFLQHVIFFVYTLGILPQSPLISFTSSCSSALVQTRLCVYNNNNNHRDSYQGRTYLSNSILNICINFGSTKVRGMEIWTYHKI